MMTYTDMIERFEFYTEMVVLSLKRFANDKENLIKKSEKPFIISLENDWFNFLINHPVQGESVKKRNDGTFIGDDGNIYQIDKWLVKHAKVSYKHIIENAMARLAP